MNIYIGLVGSIGTGKSSATKVIHSYFDRVVELKLSDLIRESLTKHNIPITRQALQNHANQQRKKFGPAFWMNKALSKISISQDVTVILDGIRNLYELIFLKQYSLYAFTLGFQADETVRLQRVLKRNRNDDSSDIREVIAMLQEEMRPDPPWGFNLQACLEATDYIVDANQSLDMANNQIATILKEISDFIRQLHHKPTTPHYSHRFK